MLSTFYPDAYLRSTYDIPFEKLYEKGFRGLIFDIDNTLVPHDAPADERALARFDRLKRIGFQTCFISNNGEARVKMFNEKIGSPYVYKAHKPNPANYIKAMGLMGTDEQTTVFIGDQLFTDVWGAKRAGIPSILVRPIHPREKIQIILKRMLEKVVMVFYMRKERVSEVFRDILQEGEGAGK